MGWRSKLTVIGNAGDADDVRHQHVEIEEPTAKKGRSGMLHSSVCRTIQSSLPAAQFSPYSHELQMLPVFEWVFITAFPGRI